jgi:hypothetical protein
MLHLSFLCQNFDALIFSMLHNADFAVNNRKYLCDIEKQTRKYLRMINYISSAISNLWFIFLAHVGSGHSAQLLALLNVSTIPS